MREAAYFASEFPERTVNSIFFGGGTPSLMDGKTVAGIIRGIKNLWPTSQTLEISIESNVSTAEVNRFESFRCAGITRLSLGIQSFDDQALVFLGREHSVADAVTALRHGKEVFSRVSADLIYARPHQSVDSWQQELGQVLEHAKDHLSLYQLTIEPGTPFAQKDIKVPGEYLSASLYETTNNLMEKAGLSAYEVSNYSRQGHECLHNLTYWLGGDYIGLGPGAHGRLTKNQQTDALYQIHTPQRWLRAVEKHHHGTARRTSLTSKERIEELVMIGLSRVQGIDSKRFLSLTGVPLEKIFDTNRLYNLSKGGFLICDCDGIRATPSGRQRLNAIIEQLLA